MLIELENNVAATTSNTGERLPHRPIILDIRNLTTEHEGIIRNRISELNGCVTIFTHPYYGHERDEVDLHTDNQKYEHSNRIKDHIIRSSGVVFIFEGSNDLDRTIFSTNLLQSDAIVVMVPTLNPRPTPQHLDRREMSEDEQWKDIIEKLYSFGVIDVTVGGRELYYKDGKPKGCVAMLVEQLITKFEVTIDENLSYPNTMHLSDLRLTGLTYAGLGV